MGQLGVCTSGDLRTSAEAIDFDDPVSAIDTFGPTTCALTVAGELYCWGSNASGEIGNGTATGPDPHPLPNRVSSLRSDTAMVAVGAGNVCAVSRQGSLKCWGTNLSGGVGCGTSDPIRANPTTVEFVDSDSP